MTRPAKISETTTTTRGKKYSVFVVTYYDETDTRKRKVFAKETDAARFKKQCDHDREIHERRQATLRNRIGEDAMKLSAGRLREAVDAYTVLAGKVSLPDTARCAIRLVRLGEKYSTDKSPVRTLDDIVTWYEAALKHEQKEMQTVAEYVEVYLAASEGVLRPTSMQELTVRLNRFCETFGDKRLDEIERTDVNQWLEGLRKKEGKPLAVNSKKHYRYALAGMFSHAIEQAGLIEDNPAARLTKSRRTAHVEKVRYKVETFTPEQAGALVKTAQIEVPSMLAPVALGLFAGLRTAEILRLTWEDHIDLEKGIIKISADVAKTAQTRNVEITPTLHEWLVACPCQTGDVAPKGGKWSYRRRKLIEKAGLSEWPHNAMRHSYGSHHLEHFGDARRTIANLGHGTDVFFKHYRQLVGKEQAAAYWSILPSDNDDAAAPPPQGETTPQSSS